MPIRIVVARGSKDKDTVYRLRHQVFIEEEQRFDHPEDRLFDRFDCLDETLNLLAYHGTTPVATMRLTLANPVGLPCSEFFDFGPAVKALDGGVAAIGWLCCLQQYRRHPGLIAGMFKLCVRKIRQGGNRHMISTVHPPVVPLLRNFGAKPVGEVFVAKGLNVPMQPVHCDFDRFPPGLREFFSDPLDVILEESDERLIYAQGEEIVRRGDDGESAFLVMRGSVRISGDGADAPKDSLLGPGELFGEVPLLDGGPQIATVMAHSREADLMRWSQQDFVRQVGAHPQLARQLCALLASRLRRTGLGTRGRSSREVLARILLDASREGVMPVNADWLALQCGIWEEELAAMTGEWEGNGWVERLGRELRVSDPVALEVLTRT